MSSFADKLYNASPVFLQNALVTAYGYKLYRKRYTGPVFEKVRRDIKRVNAMSAAEQRAFQAERLHEMIKHCRANVPYYGTLLADLGLTEQDFTDINHLNKLPILDKQKIRETPERFRAKGTTPYMIQNTSGSTGTPLSLWVDEYTYKLAMALLIDHEERQGVTFGAKRATFAGRMIQPVENINPPFSRFNRAENQQLFSAYHINNKTFSYYDSELERFQPEEIVGYPSAIYDIATQYLSHKKEPNFKPIAIITNSETLLAWQRERIELVFSCPIYDYYGTAEYVTFAGQDKNGIYRPNPIIGITELVTDEGSDENSGRIVATSLTNKAMPLLRYDLGDTATLAYSSGTQTVGTPAFISIDGRQDDYIETTDGRRIGRLDHVFKGIEGIKESQILQSQPGSITIKVVKDGFGNFNESSLRSNCKERLGDDFNVSLEYTSEIPKGRNGKFRSVIKELK